MAGMQMSLRRQLLVPARLCVRDYLFLIHRGDFTVHDYKSACERESAVKSGNNGTESSGKPQNSQIFSYTFYFGNDRYRQ